MASQRVSRYPHNGRHVVSISGLFTFSAVAASWHFSLPFQTSCMSSWAFGSSLSLNTDPSNHDRR